MAFEIGIMLYGNPHYRTLLCLTINSVVQQSWEINKNICEEFLFNKVINIDHIKAQKLANGLYKLDIVNFVEIQKNTYIKNRYFGII